MNKLLTSLLLSVTLMGGAQAQKKENYYVKHVEFPQSADSRTEGRYGSAAGTHSAAIRLAANGTDSFPSFRVSTPLPDVNGATGKRTPRSLTLRNWMLNNGYVPSRKPALKWCF